MEPRQPLMTAAAPARLAVVPLERSVPALDPAALPTVLALPAVLVALAYGIGSDLTYLAAPWALAVAAVFQLGVRPARPAALALACLAVVAGPEALIGVAAGAVSGELVARGARPAVAVPPALVAGVAVVAALGA